MEKLNFKIILTELQNSISKETLRCNNDIIQLLIANINSIYGLLSIFDGKIPEIFPIRSADRAQKFMILIHSFSAFQFSSSIFDLLLNGQYPEAAALTRSLIETVAFAEYDKSNPDIAHDSLLDTRNLPKRKTIFRFLAKNGNWPNGGPERAFERYNYAAHGNIAAVTSHWMKSSGTPQITEIWLRKYNPTSFFEISRDQMIPLLGIQEIFRKVFIKEDETINNFSWHNYWVLGHNRDLIMRLFPEIIIPENATL